MNKNEISNKILNKVFYLINDFKAEPSEIMIIFRKRNSIISHLCEELKKNGFNIYSKNYISYNSRDQIMSDFILLIEYIYDFKNEYKLNLLLFQKRVMNFAKFKEHIESIKNFNIDIIIDHIFYLSHKKILNFDWEFLFYIKEVIFLFFQVKPDYKKNNIYDFIHYIKNNEIEIQSKNNNESTNAIRLMTIHSSKGLESEYVIFYDDFSDFNPSNNIRNKNLYKINDHFIFYHFENPYFNIKIMNDEIQQIGNKVHELNNSKNQEDEEKRILYVALTRAKKKLIIISANENIKQKYIKILNKT